MRLLRAALGGLIVMLSVPGAMPAQAGQASLMAPTLTIRMEPAYLTDQGPFSAVVTLSGGTSGVSGVMYFRRYANPACTGSYDQIGGIGVNGNRDYPSPSLQNGQLGDFGLNAFFDSSNPSLNPDYTSVCVKYLRQQRTGVEVTLDRTRYESPARLEAQVTLSGMPADSPVELERFGTADCTGTPRAVTGTSFGDEAVGTHSVRVVYRGTEALAESSACRSYTVSTFIRGRIFQDFDNNGVLDEGEPGIAGETIILRRGQSTVDTQKTTEDGRYAFEVNMAGEYTVVQEPQPAGYESTTPNEIVLTVAGPALVDQNFGESSLPSTRSVAPRPTSGSPAPVAMQETGGGFALVGTLAIGLVAVAVIALLVLLYGARWRRSEES